MMKRDVESARDASIDALRVAANAAQEYVLRATTRRVNPSPEDLAGLARLHEELPADRVTPLM